MYVYLIFVFGLVIGAFMVITGINKLNPKSDPNPWVVQKARNAKMAIQMTTGLVVALMLLIKVLSSISPIAMALIPSPVREYITYTPFLAMVSHSLAFSACIEMAYMLFTDGPDEAVDPLILGLASFILLRLSQGQFEYLFMSICGMLLLFVIRACFIVPDPQTSENNLHNQSMVDLIKTYLKTRIENKSNTSP